jgi:hypothetical protein
MGIRALSLGVKWMGHDDDQSPLSGAEVKEWNYTSISPYAFMAYIGSILHLYVKQLYKPVLREPICS